MLHPNSTNSQILPAIKIKISQRKGDRYKPSDFFGIKTSSSLKQNKHVVAEMVHLHHLPKSDLTLIKKKQTKTNKNTF